MIRIATYGTFRKGQPRDFILDDLRRNGSSEIMELSGVKMYVVGECPGVVLTGNEDDIVIVELIECGALSRIEEMEFLELCDQVEGVDVGLYKRDEIETPKGTAIIYTYALGLGNNLVIEDWVDWWTRSTWREKEEAYRKAGRNVII